MKRRLIQFGCVGTITALLLSNIGCTSLAQQMASTDHETQSSAQRTYEQLPAAEQAIVQKELAKIAKYNDDYRVRREAAENLTNQVILAEVAKTDKYRSVRKGAVKNLTDQDVLAVIAITDSDPDVRRAAVENLTDQVVLAEIAKTDKDDWVRKTAIKKLTNQAVLAEIAKTDEKYDVRAAAVEKVTDQNALAEVAKNAKDSFIRCKAVDKLTEQKLIVDAVKTGIAPDADAGERFHWTLAVRKLTNQALLTDLAKNAEDSFIRCAAIRGLADQDMLVDMAKNDSDADVREAAAWSLEDSHPLKQMKYAEVAKNEANPNERIKVVQKLTDINALIALLKTEKSKEVVEQITKRINEQNVLEDIPSFDSIDFNKHFEITFGNVAAGNYRLTKNVKLESSIRIAAGNTVRINLGNYSISGADILVSQGARLELYNGKLAYSSEKDGLNSWIIPADNQIRNHGFLVLNKELSQIPVLNEGTGHLRFAEHNFLLKGGKYDIDENTEIDIGYGRLIGHIVRDGKIVPHSGKPIIFKSEDKNIGAVIVEGALPRKFIARLPRPYFAEERPSSIEGLVDLVVIEE